MSRDAIADAFYAMPPEQRRPEKQVRPRPIVPTLQVDPPRRQAADAARQLAVVELELHTIRIRWFDPSRLYVPWQPHVMAPVGRDAFVDPIGHPAEIFLAAACARCNRPGCHDAADTVLHEARHLWQYQHADEWWPRPQACPDGCGVPIWTMTPVDEDRLELDAERWAATHRGRF